MTSTAKIATASIFLIFLISSGSADFYYNSGSSDFSQNSYFKMPELDSQADIGTKLVAPFLLITLLLQIGIERALKVTLDENKSHWYGRDPKYKKKRAKIRKQSTIMALLISGMMVPTAAFQIVRTWTSAVFGSVAIIFMAVILGGFLLLLFKNFRGGGNSHAE